MPGFTVTRGLGPGATPSHLIARGFFPAVAAEAARILRGGGSAASRAIKDLTETFKISVMLVQSNGKELISPIFNSVTTRFSSEDKVVVKASAKKVSSHKPKPPKIKVKSVSVRNRKNGRD